MKFELVRTNDLNRENFNVSSTWAQYYEPDDIELLVECGYDREYVTSEIEKTGWSDDYWFPVPDETRCPTFQFEVRLALFRNPTGRTFSGYVVNHGYAIGLFGKTMEWLMNAHFQEDFKEDNRARKLDLGLEPNENLWPLEVEIPFKNVKFVYPGGSWPY